VRRKVLIVKPDGRFSTIYVEGPALIEQGPTGEILLHAVDASWRLAPDTRLDFIELQGREE
jgi:hypothetical protein